MRWAANHRPFLGWQGCTGRAALLALFAIAAPLCTAAVAQEQGTPKAPARAYENRLVRIENPQPLLADHPEFIEPMRETVHYEAPRLVDDEGADIEVRAWRFSYNARAVIEMPNRLRGANTAVIMVHPWGIDDGQGWKTPEPAGVCDFCTPEKNHLAARHTREVVNPFIKSMRGNVALVMYSLPGNEDPIRKKLYRSFKSRPTEADRRQGERELTAKLKGFSYRGASLPSVLKLSQDKAVVDYFKQFPGLDFSERYNNVAYWDLPIPVTKDIETDVDDVVIYDAPGYEPLKKFLQEQKVRNVLLTGYASDMCYCKTTAGYQNLSRDFNVFLVADASLATFPANSTPRFATNVAIAYAALDQLITQISWVQLKKSR